MPKAVAQNDFKANEYDLMALFVQNFANYITWPNKLNSKEFNIIVYKNNQILGPLTKISGVKKIKDKDINVVNVTSIDDIKNCHILIVGSMKKSELKEIAENPDYNEMLIISNQSGYTKNGSHINFVLKDNQIRFEINRTKIAERELKISSQLLKLAILVE